MSENKQAPSGERLAKVIARAGVCSRRDAESWITAGRVSVNGSPVKTPAFNVVESDKVEVDGKLIASREATQVWLYHKPAGLMVTEKDPEGRPTVFEAFARLGLPRVLTVGRLDFNTEGLLLLTNDGGLKRTLELPSTGWVRRYRVRAFGSVTQEQLNALKDGITVEGVEYGPIEAELDSVKGSNVWLTLGLREGKNREVRNVLGALGLEVNRLIRLSYGPFQLGDLPVGATEKVKMRILKDQLGKRLADTSGADFDSPISEDEGAPRRRIAAREDSRPTERDRFGGLRKRPDFKRPEPREAPPRTLHFDDGRPSESFVPKGDPKRGKGFDRDDRPARGEGFKKRFDDAPGGKGKSFGDRPKRADGDRPFGDRPRRTDGEKPFAKGPRPDRGDGERGFDSRPPRRAASGETRPFRKDGGKPFTPREDRDGERPRKLFAKGPRRESGEDRPFRKDADRPLARRTRADYADGKPSGTRPPRRDGDGGKPFGDRPPRRDGEKSFGKGPRRDGGKPFAGGRDAKPQDGRAFEGPRPGKPGGARPAGKGFSGPRGGKPGGDRPYGGARDGKPSGGKPFGGPRGGKPGGRPSGGPRKPRGQ